MMVSYDDVATVAVIQKGELSFARLVTRTRAYYGDLLTDAGDPATGRDHAAVISDEERYAHPRELYASLLVALERLKRQQEEAKHAYFEDDDPALRQSPTPKERRLAKRSDDLTQFIEDNFVVENLPE